jgi:hypothetical protein
MGRSLTKGENTGVVDFGLDECSLVEVTVQRDCVNVQDLGVKSGCIRLYTDFKVNTGGGSLGVVDGLGASLDIGAHTVVIAGSERRRVTQAVDSDGIVWGAEANSTRVTREATLSDVVRCLGTKEESITTEDGVGSECWSLKRRHQVNPRRHVRRVQVPNLEDVEESAGVKTGLLVDGGQQGGLGTLVWQQRRGEVELQTLRDLVLEFNLGAEHVRGRPGLGEGEAVVLEVVF